MTVSEDGEIQPVRIELYGNGVSMPSAFCPLCHVRTSSPNITVALAAHLVPCPNLVRSEVANG